MRLPPILGLFLVLLPATAPAQSADEYFGRGNEAYNEDQFDRAIDLYRQGLELAESTALHYNLANTFYRNGQIGSAVLHYKKALALDPADPDVQRNLSFVRETAELREPVQELTTQFAMRLPVKVWTWIFVAGFWATLALLLLPGLCRGKTNIFSRITLVVAIVALLSATVALVGYHKISRTCIVLIEDTPLRISPTPKSSERGYLRAGTQASIRKEHGAFVFLDLSDGDVGWAQSSEIGRVWE